MTFTPQTRKHLGHDDQARDWLDETIGNVVLDRPVSNPSYTKTDGENSGPLKHYVPYNWIMKNIADNYVIGVTRRQAVANVSGLLHRIGRPALGLPTDPADFDTSIRDSVYAICDWEENLFKSSSSGDARGTRLDVPNDPGVLARVGQAQASLGDLANRPLQ
ncbi:hypothetical protein LMG29660_00159 [Burkholderia puraquae]|uniref:Uncharacterized protein n=1 Tax=Burkholderia puraquae TaxID=1904757 RepID=A0A6J5CYU9_9BURK|nr:hypothetical protein [Burkholderia puraquae]CAB3746301.1 hypothetical protein LMG29660_00159 [Burkholderia puraquae]